MATELTSGVTLSVDKTGTGGSLTKLIQITSIDGPGASADAVEITDYDSTTREFRAGLSDPGEFTFEFNLDPVDTEQRWLMGLPAAGTTHDFQISIPTTPKATLIDFAGFATAASPGFGAPGEVITGSVTIKVAGAVAWSTEA